MVILMKLGVLSAVFYVVLYCFCLFFSLFSRSALAYVLSLLSHHHLQPLYLSYLFESLSFETNHLVGDLVRVPNVVIKQYN